MQLSGRLVRVGGPRGAAWSGTGVGGAAREEEGGEEVVARSEVLASLDQSKEHNGATDGLDCRLGQEGGQGGRRNAGSDDGGRAQRGCRLDHCDG